jgi:hypothetical protein
MKNNMAVLSSIAAATLIDTLEKKDDRADMLANLTGMTREEVQESMRKMGLESNGTVKREIKKLPADPIKKKKRKVERLARKNNKKRMK